MTLKSSKIWLSRLDFSMYNCLSWKWWFEAELLVTKVIVSRIRTDLTDVSFCVVSQTLPILGLIVLQYPSTSGTINLWWDREIIQW